MKKQKLLALTIAGVMTFSCVSAANFAVAESKGEIFDENNIVARLGILSDVHQTGTGGDRDEQRFTAAIKRLNKEADNKLDGISISGDLTDYDVTKGAQQVKKVLDANIIGDTKVTFTLGNHDIDAVKYDGKNIFADVLGDKYYSYDEPDSKKSTGNRHTIMGGYHFLSVYTNDFWNPKGPAFKTETKTWLDSQLKAITSAQPNKYVFVSTHMLIQDTAYGSEADIYDKYWSTADLTSILKKYPQVITLGGHLHHACNDERSIWQGDFTALNVPSTREICFEEKGFVETGTSSSVFQGNDKYSAGYYFEIDNKNNIKINRLDFLNNEEIKQPWVLAAPTSNKTHLTKYTAARKDANKAPEFPTSANFQLKEVMPKSFSLSFDNATDDDMVYSYRVEAYNKTYDKIVRSYKMLSFFHLHPNLAEMKRTYSRSVGNLVDGNEWEIRVYATDSWGVDSQPHIIKIPPTKLPTDPKEIISNQLNIVTANNGFIADLSAKKYPVIKGSAVRVATDNTLKANTIVFNGTQKSNLTVNFTEDDKKALSEKFTIDTYFKIDSQNGKNQTIFSTGEKGINAYIDGSTKFLMCNVDIGDETYTFKSSNIISPNRYYYFVVEYNLDNELSFIVDGQKHRTFLPKGNVNFSSNELMLGGARKDDSITDSLLGSIFKFRVTDEFYTMTHTKLLYKDAITFISYPELIGDVNLDDKFNTLDSLAILKHAVQMQILSPESLIQADLNGDKAVDTRDALSVLKAIVGI